MKTPAVLVDDPRANHEYDLQRALASWSSGVAAVIEPLPQQVAASDAGTTPAFGPSDSPTTRALKAAQVRYTVRAKGKEPGEFDVAAGPRTLVQLAGSSLVVVCFVSPATFPLMMQLSQDEATRSSLRVGITGVRMDGNYNLARKLIVDGGIAYHEHTRVLEKVLSNRLALMLAAHTERLRTTPG